jgi:hypothetical protein
MTRHLDYFYEEIKTLFKNVREICGQCKKNEVETKIAIKDTYYPTFVILRKFYCFHCWLSVVSLRPSG